MSESLENKLLNKSIEAFILGIEIYNKPTIKYRVEGFSFFICNAWELMLKSHLLKTKGSESIYFKNNPNRTYSLEKCIKLVFTNNKDPLRINLEKIIELRNTSTHFITEEYEMVYIPLFQSCVLNFSTKIKEFHNFDITTIIPQNFLTLNISMEAIEDTKIIAKYPELIAQKLIQKNEEINSLAENNNDKFSINIIHNHYITKNKSEADNIVAINKNSDDNVTIIKELKDPSNSHPYTAKACIEEIKKQLERLNIELEMHQYNFLLFIDYYDLKVNDKYCYVYDVGAQPAYSYSRQTIDLIVQEIKKDPEDIIQNLKNKLKTKKS